MPGKESHIEEVPVGDQDEGDREEGAAPQEGEQEGVSHAVE
jgi:hypothetical protein